jgi:hypothetical protein
MLQAHVLQLDVSQLPSHWVVPQALPQLSAEQAPPEAQVEGAWQQPLTQVEVPLQSEFPVHCGGHEPSHAVTEQALPPSVGAHAVPA